MIDRNTCDVTVTVTSNELAKNGDAPVTDKFAGVIFSVDGRNFEGVLDLREIPALYKKASYKVPVFLNDPDFSLRFLAPGVRFDLVRGKKIGEGVVLPAES